MSRRLRPDERVGGLALNSSRAWRCPGEVMGQWAPDLLGHASIQITADFYTHLLPKVKEQAIDVLDEVLTGSK